MGAKRVERLEDALADCDLSIATTAVRARQVFEPLTPSSVAELASTFEAEHQLAIVFGREEWGLRHEEIALCLRTASVPTSPAFPTMNLAMTVGVFCYEMSKGLRSAPTESEPAPGQLIQRLHERAKEFLLEIGFLHQTNPDRMFNELRALAGRAMLSKREASLLLALLASGPRPSGLLTVSHRPSDRSFNPLETPFIGRRSPQGHRSGLQPSLLRPWQGDPRPWRDRHRQTLARS